MSTLRGRMTRNPRSAHEKGAELMGKYGISVPKGVAITSLDQLQKAIKETFPGQDELQVLKAQSNFSVLLEGKKLLFSLEMIDPGGMANWLVTHVDWSEHKWHPKSYRLQDVSYELLQNLTSIDESLHETSEARKQVDIKPCLWNGAKRPCYLFARKFYPKTLDKLTQLFSNYTAAY
ncbi:hypothetical protein RND81_10G028900 [Saponaria officinalis]|uniref:Uncharacterized protein n=1 Tax=Saponaria officinalis TaxID=3572 RepID=A0AAW1HXY7_SAPOF